MNVLNRVRGLIIGGRFRDRSKQIPTFIEPIAEGVSSFEIPEGEEAVRLENSVMYDLLTVDTVEHKVDVWSGAMDTMMTSSDDLATTDSKMFIYDGPTILTDYKDHLSVVDNTTVKGFFEQELNFSFDDHLNTKYSDIELLTYPGERVVILGQDIFNSNGDSLHSNYEGERVITSNEDIVEYSNGDSLHSNYLDNNVITSYDNYLAVSI